MPAYVSTLIYLMAVGTVVLNAGIVLCVLALTNRSMRAQLTAFMRGNAMWLIILLSVLSIAGTLLMQYAGALEPCVLCWWQRVFMYPIGIIAIIAFFKNVKFSDIADYVLVMSFLGALVALYQHLLQILPAGALIPCSATDDCAIRTIFYFNFVTIPWMALTVFVAIFLIALCARVYKRA